MSLEEKYESLLEKCVASLKSSKDIVEQHLKNDELEEELLKYRNLTIDYCMIDFENKKLKNAIIRVEEEVNNGQIKTEKDIIESFNSYVQLDSMEGNYTEHEIWESLFQGNLSVVEVQNKEKKINPAHFVQVNDSLMCSNVFTPPADPITKTIIRNPYKNKICKHVYEKESIFNYIRSMKRRAKCPYIGCNSRQLHINDLQPDEQLKRKIEEYLRNKPESEDESDDE